VCQTKAAPHRDGEAVSDFLAKRTFLLNFNIAQDKILQTIDKRRGKCYNYRVRRARRDIIVLWI
jgi:hypothetical protein